MKTAALIFGLVISMTAVSYGQVRTITNATLEKYQQKRLAAERDYRNNYERLGFPSPEELERQREADMKARLELAEQLRQARLEKERLELERRSLDLEAQKIEIESVIVDSDPGFYGGGYWGGFGGFDGRGGFGGFRRHFPRRVYPSNWLLPMVDRGGAYRATPFGVIQTPSPRPAFGLRSRPVFRRRHR